MRSQKQRPKRLRPKELLSDALVCIGAAAVAVGAALIYLPAGVMIGGVGAIWIGWLIARGGGGA